MLGGARELVVAREITKKFETIARMPLADAAAWFAADANRERGEFVLIVDAPPPAEAPRGAATRCAGRGAAAARAARRDAAVARGAHRRRRDRRSRAIALYARALALKK